MKRSNEVYIKDILESIEIINRHLNGMTEFEFTKNLLVQDAVIRRFEIIGEASSKISAEFKLKHTQIEWQLMKDMRNKLAHEYFGISMNTLYHTVKKDLPLLHDSIKKIL